MNDDEAWRRLQGCPVAVLATSNADGSIHLVPFFFARLGPNSLVSAVDSKPKSSRRLRRIENIGRDPRVTVLAHEYDDDWSKLWWVRAEGVATVSDAPPPEAGRALQQRYPPYEDHRLGPWISVLIRSISGWSASG